MKHTLEVDGILLEFGTRSILSNIYLKCETGTITGMLGRNGTGKTCLLNVIYGILQASSQSVRLDTVPLFHAYKHPDLLTYLPQFNFIPTSLSLKRIFSDFDLNFPAFETCFPEFKTKYTEQIRNLSGGQRRLIEVYVIIKAKSRFSMLDEPFSHITPLQIDKIKEIIQETKQTKGFLITDHLYQQVTDISDKLYVLTAGKAHLTNDITDLERHGYARLY